MTQPETTQQDAPPVEQEQVPPEQVELATDFKNLEAKPVSIHLPTAGEVICQWPNIMSIATEIYNSGLAPSALVKLGVGAVAIVVAKGMELGIPPITACQMLHVVNGKVGMSAELMRALILSRCPGARIIFTEQTADGATMRMWRPGQEWLEVSFTMTDARRAHLDAKDVWKNYPQDMCVARATSRGARQMFPDIVMGCGYTPEELSDLAPPAPVPGADPDAPTAPRRAERQEPVAPPPLDAKTVYLQWYDLAAARENAGDTAFAGFDDRTPEASERRPAMFKVFAESIIARTLSREEPPTLDELAQIVADMAKYGDARPFDQREPQ